MYKLDAPAATSAIPREIATLAFQITDFYATGHQFVTSTPLAAATREQLDQIVRSTF